MISAYVYTRFKQFQQTV